MDTDSLAFELAKLRPDRGNRYAPRSVRTKGAAAFAQWEQTVRALADWAGRFTVAFDHGRFIDLCYGEEIRANRP